MKKIIGLLWISFLVGLVSSCQEITPLIPPNPVFKDFQSDLLIKNTQVILTRNGRKLAQKDTQNDHLIVNLANLVQDAQPTDQVTFTLVAQRKNGELVPLLEQPAYNFPIRN